MPILHTPVQQPPLPVAPNILPQSQRVLPNEPSRRITPNKEAGRGGVNAEKKRRREEGDRGGQLDLEV